ncbi:hypothetical protein Hanom_Chr08g00722501 [Helianthus anomalus]
MLIIHKERNIRQNPNILKVAANYDIFTFAYNKQTNTDYHITHFFFFSSLTFSSTTGAAGMLNHHSLSLRFNLSVLDLLIGEYLVHSSNKTAIITYLIGTTATNTAVITSATANRSLA